MNKLIKMILLLLVLVLSPTTWAITLNYNITGISNPDAMQNALNRLQVIAENNGAPLTDADIQHFHATAADNIGQALQPYGYYRAQITGQLQQHGTIYNASYKVIPGPLLHITSLNVFITGPGSNNTALQNAIASFPLKRGQILNTEDYKKAKKALFSTALQQGYLTAYFIQQQILIDTTRYTADITLQLATGPRYYFGPVIFSPNPFATTLLKKFVPFNQGEPYSSEKLLGLQSNLSNSNYFQEVSVQGLKDKAQNNNVPVSVYLLPRLANQYNFSLGYGTDTGPRAGIGWNWRRATASGNYLSTQLNVSQVQNSLQAKYVIPGNNPLTDQYNIYTGILTTNINAGNSRTYQIGANQVINYGNWQRTIALNYQFERFHFTNQPYQNSALLLPSISLLNVTQNDPLYPTKGNRFNISIQGAAAALFSTTSFIQTEVQDKFIISPTDKSRLILRGDIGYTLIHDFNDLPLSLRFFAGGTQSVRAYEYQSLGLPDGGRYLIVGSVELQHQIIGRWNAAIFYDAGNAFDNFNQNLDRGAGIGVVWISPIGPLELTLGKALDLPGHPLKIQFAMGPDL